MQIVRNNAGMTGRVLIVVADLLLAYAMRITLQRAGLQVVGIAHTENEAVALARARHPEVVVSSTHLGDAP